MSKTQHYKVKKGKAVGGFGGKIFKEGEVVTAANFPKGNAEQLLAMKYLEKCDAPKVEDNPPADTGEKRLIADLSKRIMADPENNNELKLVSVEDVDGKAISAELTRLEIDHKEDVDKDILFKLLPLEDKDGKVKCIAVSEDDVSKSEIIDELKRLNTEHKASDNKATLFALLPLSE